MSIKSKLAFLWFCFHSLCGRSKNLHTFSTNHIEYYNQLEPGHLHFPCFMQFSWFYLASHIIFHRSDWPLWLNGLSFLTVRQNSLHYWQMITLLNHKIQWLKTFKISGQVLQNFSLWTCDFQQTNKLTIILN